MLTNLLPTLEVHHTMGHHPYGRAWLRAVLVAAGTVALPMLAVPGPCSAPTSSDSRSA